MCIKVYTFVHEITPPIERSLTSLNWRCPKFAAPHHPCQSIPSFSWWCKRYQTQVILSSYWYWWSAAYLGFGISTFNTCIHPHSIMVTMRTFLFLMYVVCVCIKIAAEAGWSGPRQFPVGRNGPRGPCLCGWGSPDILWLIMFLISKIQSWWKRP